MRLTELKLPLDHTESDLRNAILIKLGIAADELVGFTVFRRSYDARNPAAIVFIYTLDIELKNDVPVLKRLRGNRHVGPTPDTSYHFVARAPQAAAGLRPVVIGTGPCGLFAGLILAQMGFRPLILERGKAVRERTQDTWSLWRKGQLNPESNVQFGEGGAGTFSDGKLYSQIKDPQYRGRKVLTEFVKAGAPAEILYVSKPHIGTFKLVTMVENMRAEIEALGGEIRFQSRVEKIDIEHGQTPGQVRGLELASGEFIAASHVVLAVGHSARDTFAMLHAQGVHVEAKPFSIGVRIEHPQSLIDRTRFGPNAGNPLLGAADYKLVHHCSNGRSAYSFCMCPGGTVVAATSEPGRVVTNGMSQYSRNERNANSALVVGVTPADYPGSPGENGDPLAGIEFQRRWESLAFAAGGSDYKAPAQRVGDFRRRAGVDRTRRRVALLHARGKNDRPRAVPAGLRGCRAARSAAGLRPRDRRLLHGRRTADRSRNAYLVAAPHHPRRELPEHQHAWPVPCRRRRRIRRRHPLGSRRRHQGCRSRSAQSGRGIPSDFIATPVPSARRGPAPPRHARQRLATHRGHRHRARTASRPGDLAGGSSIRSGRR